MTEQTHYADWKKLTALPKEPRPNEKVGAKFVVVKNSRFEFNQGDVVELVENDETPIPYFKRINQNESTPCSFSRLAPLPQPKEKKVKKLVPFTDEFDWCEEGVLVMVEDLGERYAVRAKGDKVWTVDDGKKLCEIENAFQLTTQKRSDCQKVIHEVHRPLTKREFAEFMQDHKGMVKDTCDSVIYYNSTSYDCENENESVRNSILFRFRGTEEWYPVTTELYELAKEGTK